ncbi:MAG: hypothetical protein CFE43_21180 [Burkholderiales bacterium PBB3]|nr:MAG: hypothetical protein CFE43_21180 [Burkholderiales bacterium PBB3]
MALGNAPPADLVASDGNLKNNAVQSLIVRVASAATWLEQLLGPSDWGINKLIGAKIDGLIPPWSGILLFRVPGATDASGHGDLWRNMPCRVDCHSDFARAARSVEIWRLK